MDMDGGHTTTDNTDGKGMDGDEEHSFIDGRYELMMGNDDWKEGG